MKEYKVVPPKASLRNWNQKYEDLLNQHARDGWVVNTILQSGTIVFERDKNR
jgi:hypothetical protein|tara:strand:- start:1790 stop:1945 length:156 start_codon:yes stop_codon:yes gene_type:complete